MRYSAHIRMWICLAFTSWLYAIPAFAEPLETGQGVRAAGLWCFPQYRRPDEWFYIPAAGQLAMDDNKKPRFSFVRYAMTKPENNTGASSISQADGGGILHFLVLYDTPAEQVAEAQKVLRERLNNKALELKGPVVFDSGRYTLVSSILTDRGEKKPRVLATGNAPVLEGNQLALSFELSPEKAMLLMESFKMNTPDISIVFDLGFSGITEAYEARVLVDWSEMRENKAFEAGGSAYFVSAQVKTEIDRLMRNNTIRMTSVGGDTNMEALVGRVYEKVLSLLFEPAPPERIPESQQGGLMDALGSLVGQSGALSAKNTTGFGAHVGYQLKDMRSEGSTVLDFNHRARVERHAYVTFNIGDLYERYGENEDYFRAVLLTDPTFRQREIQVTVDGALLPEFKDMVNSVTVTLRKIHKSGESTIKELVIDKTNARGEPGILRMIYGWQNDKDPEAWLNYEYRTHWSFKGGGQYKTPWIESNAAMINLYAPYERRKIQVVNAGSDLSQQGVRAIIVGLSYPFFGITRRAQMVIRSGVDMNTPEIDITLPRDVFKYDYSLTWIMNDSGRPQIHGSDGSGLIFLDPPPEPRQPKPE